ncbi:hypothetical protein PISMIDRAFT_679085 [Pisolithus microcarpus 441]|uniref:Uncharacterized protein n=1 Tax=Pisolithus microcarpus 441 TaxID=765257 RepID=A0A0C9Z3H9_9AGAM|nr:hypothetical protein PISMIDRAFT_679085 [Pisolithus microcarpus 441]
MGVPYSLQHPLTTPKPKNTAWDNPPVPAGACTWQPANAPVTSQPLQQHTSPPSTCTSNCLLSVTEAVQFHTHLCKVQSTHHYISNVMEPL